MIEFRNINNEIPFVTFYRLYKEAVLAGEKSPEVFMISSYSKNNNEVDSRIVNLKFIDDTDFIFFTSYESPKARQFSEHPQVTSIIFWESTNTQIRIKGNIAKIPRQSSQDHFANRDINKNAAAISSNQSSNIESYDDIIKNFEKALQNEDLFKCPSHWGGYKISPYYIEFWIGNKSRLNKRDAYQKINDTWEHFILQP